MKAVEQVSQYVGEFMKENQLRGMEFLICNDGELCIRAAGKGMLHPKGTVLEGMEIWESIQDILKHRKELSLTKK